MSMLKLINPLPSSAPQQHTPPQRHDFAEFLIGITEDFAALRGRRRLISLPPKHLETIRAALRLVIRDAKEQEVRRLIQSAEELDEGLKQIQYDAHGYSQRFALRRLFDSFLDEARRTIADIQSGEQVVQPRLPGARPKVLVVDDEIIIHRMVERAIGRDVDVLNAVNCHGALATLENYQPDLIVLDVELPDMKGTDFLAELKADKKYASIPVVMLSNNYDDGTVVKGLVEGALDFISKDLKTISLRPRLMEILVNGRARLAGSA